MSSEQQYIKSHIIVATLEDLAQRLDNFLLKKHPNVPKTHIYKIIRTGQVRVNSARKKAHYKIQLSDQIRVPPIVITETEKPAIFSNNLHSWIIYEDNKLLVLNKPEGIAVHGGSNIAYGIIELAKDYLASNDVYLAHRLDRETSGIIILCKKRSVLREIHELFRNNEVNKVYLAILDGALQHHGIMKNNMQKMVLSSGERICKIADEGKLAISNFRVLGIKNNFTLAMVKIHTGRMHQIRLHAAYHDCPIVGDRKYNNKNTKLSISINRMCLHSSQISFALAGEQYEFSAPLDKKMQKILSCIGLDDKNPLC